MYTRLRTHPKSESKQTQNAIKYQPSRSNIKPINVAKLQADQSYENMYSSTKEKLLNKRHPNNDSTTHQSQISLTSG